MRLVLNKAPGEPWRIRLEVPVRDLALTAQGTCTEEEEVHQAIDTNAEYLEAGRLNEIEHELDDGALSKEGDAGNTESADEQDGKAGEKEQDDHEDETGDNDENDGTEHEDSSLTIIVPSHEITEIPAITIDEETLRTFNDMSTEQKMTLLALAVFSFVLWAMLQASESITVTIVIGE